MDIAASFDPPAVPVTLPGATGAGHRAICLDSATRMAGLALVSDGQVLAEQAWHAGRGHTGALAARLRDLATISGYDLPGTTLLSVCTGPGSFNGIRTGLATALGLASGLGAALYGVPALDLLAFPHADRAQAQRAVLPAGRGHYYSALYSTRNGRWRRVSPYVIRDLESLVADSPAKCLWCGELEEAELGRLASLLGSGRHIAPPVHRVRRAAYLLPLALAAAAAGVPGSPAAVQPLYLRRPAITTPRVAVAAGI